MLSLVMSVCRSVCPSVRISLERGYTISTRPIGFKSVLKFDSGVMHVPKKVWFRNSNFNLQIYATYEYLQLNLCSQCSLMNYFDFAENQYTCTLYDDAYPK